MSLTAVLESTGTAAYAVSSEGQITAWNSEAERLLGFRACRVIGQPCYATIAGVDLFGNRFCGESCPVRRMVARREPVHAFELVVQDARGRSVRLRLFILVAHDGPGSEAEIVHLMESIADDDARPNDGETDSKIPPAAASHLRLTPREVEILRLLEEGRTTRWIADQLYICPKTVRNHIQNIHEKLGVHNRLEAVCVARRAALI